MVVIVIENDKDVPGEQTLHVDPEIWRMLTSGDR
jgi:hypothetical protein